MALNAIEGGAGMIARRREKGMILLHKFEQVIGEETCRIERVSDTLTIGMKFKFTDRNGKWHFDILSEPALDFKDLIRDIDEDRIGVFGSQG